MLQFESLKNISEKNYIMIPVSKMIMSFKKKFSGLFTGAGFSWITMTKYHPPWSKHISRTVHPVTEAALPGPFQMPWSTRSSSPASPLAKVQWDIVLAQNKVEEDKKISTVTLL